MAWSSDCGTRLFLTNWGCLGLANDHELDAIGIIQAPK
jgi:hypothetical protein